MRSLLFWRNKPPAAQGAPAAAATPATANAATAVPAAKAAKEAETAGVLPLQRLVHALALDDDRAADTTAKPGAAYDQVLMAASVELARVGTEVRYTPHRPSLLPQLLEVLNDEDASLRALSRIVAQDPQLTGELLRSANSPLYRVSEVPVESVERATAVLGTQGIRTLISLRLLQPLSAGGNMRGHFGDVIWQHSLYSASAAEAWAARTQDADPFTAHLMALLHGLGCVTVYRVLADIHASLPMLKPDAAVIAGALLANSGVTAGRIAGSWGLSERTRLALEAQSSAAPVAAQSALGRALQFGLLSGAAAVLCRNGRLTEKQAVQQMELAGFGGPQTLRVWDRLVQAYVRP
jgi:HD-like signal output (HDOD) protein